MLIANSKTLLHSGLLTKVFEPIGFIIVVEMSKCPWNAAGGNWSEIPLSWCLGRAGARG